MSRDRGRTYAVGSSAEAAGDNLTAENIPAAADQGMPIAAAGGIPVAAEGNPAGPDPGTAAAAVGSVAGRTTDSIPVQSCRIQLQT
jgi:hypothetical protein